MMNMQQEKQDDTFKDIEPALEKFLETLDVTAYLVHPSLHYFEEEVFGEMIAALRNCLLPRHYHTYKDVIRDKLASQLSFGPQDLILCTDGIVYAKRFFTVETPGEGADRRACGLDHDTLVAYKEKFFPQESYKEKIFSLFPSLVEEVLNFRVITPPRFKKIFIPAFINLLDIIVIGFSDLEDNRSIRGLSLHLLREVFDDLMFFIAEDILFHFSNADRKAIEFLAFFSVHETIDANGKRHKANPILDESNHAWNITTIRSTMMQHKKAKQAVYDKKNALINIQNKLEGFKMDQKEIALQKAKTQEEWDGVEATIENIHKTLRKLEESDAEEVRFMEDGEEKVFQRKLLMTKLFKKEDKLLFEKNRIQRVFDEIEHKIANKQKDIDIWEKKYAENQAILAAFEAKEHPMDKQYNRIKKAFAKSLTAR